MPTVREIYEALDGFAPYRLAMPGDPCGLQLGDPDGQVRGGLIALDVTIQAVEEAVRLGANLIVTHHPLIFHPIQSLRGDEVVCAMITEKIASISAHTNLDAAEDGVNDALAQILVLEEIQPFAGGDGRIGRLRRPLPAGRLSGYVQKRLGAEAVRYYGGSSCVSKLAVVSGSGGSFLAAAREVGADALLTGEAKHSDFVEAVNWDFPLLTAGHYDTEKVILPVLREKLQKVFPEIPWVLFDSFPTRTVL